MLGSVPIVMMGHVEELYARHNVRCVINLMDEYSGPIATYQKLNISQAYFPTVDHFEPTLETLEAATRVLSECKKERVGSVRALREVMEKCGCSGSVAAFQGRWKYESNTGTESFEFHRSCSKENFETTEFAEILSSTHR